MPTQLTSTAQWDFVPVSSPEQCAPIAEHLGEQAVYEVALCWGVAPTAAEFAQLLVEGTIRIWQCKRSGEKDVVAYAIEVYRFEDHELFIWCEGGWDNAVIREILPLLSAAAFQADPNALHMWMVIPLPMPKGSPECLLSLGFDPWKDDMAKGLKQTFGLERNTWRIYTGQQEPSDSPSADPPQTPEDYGLKA